VKGLQDGLLEPFGVRLVVLKPTKAADALTFVIEKSNHVLLHADIDTDVKGASHQWTSFRPPQG